MCLSPEVDLSAGIAITAIAVDAIRNNRHTRTLPLALIPTVFALHSFSSAIVWFSLRGDVSAALGDMATNFYLFIAFVLLPIFVPITVLLIEPQGWRRYSMIAVTVLGIAAGFDFMKHLVLGHTSAVACDRYIDFHVSGAATISGVLYVVATCGAMLLSAQPPLVYWGILNVIVVAALNQWQSHGLPSLWCFWAAITSGFVAWFMRWMNRRHRNGIAWPWEI